MGLVTILIFAAIVLLTMAIGSMSKSRPVKQRLIRLADGTVSAPPKQVQETTLHHKDSGWLTRILTPFATVATRGEDLADAPIRRRLAQAGYRRPSALVIYMGSRIVLALALPITFLIASPMWQLEQLQLFTLLGVSVVTGLVAPSHFVDRKRAARQRRIILGLPDALDLMVVCVEAGLGINASLNRIAKEFKTTNPILSSEFELVVLETRAGRSSTEALRSLSFRSGVAEVASLVAMLVQTERFGTNLADTLRVHADALRVQRMQRAEELAGKAPLKMMFPTLVIFAATLLVTLGPGMLQLVGFFADRK